jgi:hypothetical protein
MWRLKCLIGSFHDAGNYLFGSTVEMPLIIV